MKSIIRIQNFVIKNIKNVGKAILKTGTTFKNITEANIIALYGPNGSGKTAFIEGFSLLKKLISTSPLPKQSEYLMRVGEKTLELYFTILINNKFGEFTVKYQCILTSSSGFLKVHYEKISYKENISKKKFKELIEKSGNEFSIRNKPLNSLNEALRVKIMVANELASNNKTSFIFRNELKDVLKPELTEAEFEIIESLKNDFIKDFFIIKEEDSGLIMANILLPIKVYLEEENNHLRGNLPYNLKSSMVLSKEVYNIYLKVVEEINLVLKNIIPHLQIKLKKINEENLKNGVVGIRCELLSVKNNLEIPLRCESNGILKIITILSALIAVYNNPNASVVIDELDSGIFEHLLGEILSVVAENGKGQLFFTSHNLRPLEVLNSKNLWFTTNNEDHRYIKLKGIKQGSNARDIYLRSVQLASQNDDVYHKDDFYDIKEAFKKAGEVSENHV